MSCKTRKVLSVYLPNSYTCAHINTALADEPALFACNAGSSNIGISILLVSGLSLILLNHHVYIQTGYISNSR